MSDTAEAYDGPDRRAAQRWRMNKDISVADLITIVSAAVAVLYSWSTLDKRIDIIERMATVQTTVDKRQDDESLRYQGRIDAALSELNRKLDRLMERK